MALLSTQGSSSKIGAQGSTALIGTLGFSKALETSAISAQGSPHPCHARAEVDAQCAAITLEVDEEMDEAEQKLLAAIRRWARRQTIAMPHSSGEAGSGITNVAPHEYGRPGLASPIGAQGPTKVIDALGSTEVASAPSIGAQGSSSQVGAHSPIGAQGSTKVIGAYGSNEDGGAYNAVRPATTEASPGETCMMTAASIYGEDAVVERGEAAGPNHGAAAATAPSPEGDKSSRVVAGDDLEPRRGSDLTCMLTAASKYGGTRSCRWK